MNIIGERLKELRVTNKLSQENMGKILNVSQDTISLWERGKALPAVENVILICQKFEVSSDYLLGLKEY